MSQRIQDQELAGGDSQTNRSAPRSLAGPLTWFIAPLASLKLTVVLFLAAITIILAGTFAQVRADIWEVIREYFRVDFRQLGSAPDVTDKLRQLFVWIDPALFFPPAFFPKDPVFPAGFGWMQSFWPRGTPEFPWWLGIWFPKGWIIGALMMVNLVAAHLVRFRLQAWGQRLITGLVILGLGALLTVGVIVSGSNPNGLQATPLVSYDTFWWLMQTSLFGVCGVCVYAAASADANRSEQRWLFGITAAILAAAAIFSFRADPSSESTMRILYQLIKATLAGVVLLAGCIALFRKRAGIVLLHAGIGLMMAYDVLVGVQHVESRMQIAEGETVNFSRDIREPELAIVRPASANEVAVTAIDDSLFNQKGAVVKDSRLPFEIHVLDYMANSQLRGPMEKDEEGKPFPNPATQGIGTKIIARPEETAKGTDTRGGVDIPSAYVQLKSPSGEDLGTWLVSAHFDGGSSEQTVEVDGQKYDLALRFRRLYNPYTITLKDFQRNVYQGTDRPRDFSSFIVLNDPDCHTTFEHRIWMNNPMRYGGKTFYQSEFLPGDKGTVLQVVDNAGWMTPYVACMMVVVGMLYHFGQTLLVFLNRRLRSSRQATLGTDPSDETVVEHPQHIDRRLDIAGWVVSAALVISVGAVVGSLALPARESSDEFHISAFSELPMWYRGRAMPIDSFARNALMQLSDRQSYKDSEGKSQPASRWLLEVMAGDGKADKLRVIRIENDDVREEIGLPKREGFTYSLDELRSHLEKILEQAEAAQKTPAAERSLYQRKVLELAHRIIFHSFLTRTLGPAPSMPAPETPIDPRDVQQMASRAHDYLQFLSTARQVLQQFSDAYGLGPLPLVVPTHLEPDERAREIEGLNSNWEPVTIAHVYDQFYHEFPATNPPAIEKFLAIVDAWRDGDVARFNQSVEDYQSFLDRNAPKAQADLPLAQVDFESGFNRVGAFNLCSWLYVFAFILAVLGWLFLPQVFERSAFWLILLIFLVHTAALVGRIYISGRPPVTNLYSSAVFIGWATVLIGLIAESITRLGLGNVAAAAAGFLTLRIASGLAADGDTFVPPEAVLDTQFWLATHVVCITLGYATTYMAGLFGLLYLFLGIFTKQLQPKVGKELARMTYGIVCFATFFSFWGTVLGGLWADDSWGRFWGWDPKENGALIIVLWNALVLHARWDGMVRDRGLAVLAVLGNIVVSWSWFGVNELGEGLHSYGFTEGRLMMLALFVMSQILVAGVGLLPREWWRSVRAQAIPEALHDPGG